MTLTLELLLYTPAQQRDWLGHLIVRATHGTWSHAAIAIYTQSPLADIVLVEAVPPRVRCLSGSRAAVAYAGAGGRAVLQPHDDWAANRAQERALSWMGKPYALDEIVFDFFANTFALRPYLPGLPGTGVCSHVAFDVAQTAGDPRAPLSVPAYGVTPPELGQRFLNMRTPPPHKV
jgi:hypothetical protein